MRKLASHTGSRAASRVFRTVVFLAAIGLSVSAAAAERQLAASTVFSLEPVDQEFIVLVDVGVHASPSERTAVVGKLMGGMQLKATGHISGTEWYRVELYEGGFGFIQSQYLRAADGTNRTQEQPAVQEAAYVAAGEIEVFQDCDACPQMVRLPSGPFIMGSNFGDLTEAPARPMALSRNIALGRYEVTVAEWTACAAAKACAYRPKEVENPETTPVRNLSWEDAVEYVEWLRRTTGKAYRLPSEAEWEFAARGGSKAAYWWGDKPEPGQADCRGCDESWSHDAPAATDAYPANPFGLHAMLGGTAEWVQDCWYRSHKDAHADGTPREKLGCQRRVLRGGNWRDSSDRIRASSRQPHDANIPHVANGLRVALEQP